MKQVTYLNPKLEIDKCFILCSLILVVAVFIWVYDWYAGRPRPRFWGRTPVTVCTWWTVWRWRSPVQRRPSRSCSKVKHWTFSSTKNYPWSLTLTHSQNTRTSTFFNLFDKKKQIDDIHCLYYTLFHLFKKKLIMGKVCMRVYMHYYFFLHHKVNLWFYGDLL